MDDSKNVQETQPQQQAVQPQKQQTGSRHQPFLRGPTGAIFVVITISLILFVQGFATTAWVEGAAGNHSGIWQTCENVGVPPKTGWLVAVQVFACLSLIGIIAVVGVTTIYVNGRGNTISKNMTILTLAALSAITGILMFITIGVYGAHMEKDAKLSWSYFLVLASAILCLLAVPLSIVQAKRSNVRDCGC